MTKSNLFASFSLYPFFDSIDGAFKPDLFQQALETAKRENPSLVIDDAAKLTESFIKESLPAVMRNLNTNAVFYLEDPAKHTDPDSTVGAVVLKGTGYWVTITPSVKKETAFVVIDLNVLANTIEFHPEAFHSEMMKLIEREVYTRENHGGWPKNAPTPKAFLEEFKNSDAPLAMVLNLCNTNAPQVLVLGDHERYTSACLGVSELNAIRGDRWIWRNYVVGNLDSTPFVIIDLNKIRQIMPGHMSMAALRDALVSAMNSKEWLVSEEALSLTLAQLLGRGELIQGLLKNCQVDLRLHSQPESGQAPYWRLEAFPLGRVKPSTFNGEHVAMNSGQSNFGGQTNHPQDRWPHLNNDYLISVLEHYALTQVTHFPPNVNPSTIPQGLELLKLIQLRLGADRMHLGMAGLFTPPLASQGVPPSFGPAGMYPLGKTWNAHTPYGDTTPVEPQKRYSDLRVPIKFDIDLSSITASDGNTWLLLAIHEGIESFYQKHGLSCVKSVASEIVHAVESQLKRNPIPPEVSKVTFFVGNTCDIPREAGRIDQGYTNWVMYASVNGDNNPKLSQVWNCFGGQVQAYN